MSRFIRSHEEIAAARNEARRAAKTGAGAGFTEAELEAASWAKRLPEVQLQIARKTNGEKRSLNTKGADLRLVRSKSLRGGAVAVAQENPEPLIPDSPGRKLGKEKTKKEKKEKKSHEKKNKKKKEKKEAGQGIEKGDDALAQTPKTGDISAEVGLLEAKSLEMKNRRKIAKEMRREQRRLKREERERFRQEQEELEAAFQDDPGLQDAIDNLIQVVQQERPPKAALDTDEAEGQAPFRSLEELVAQLDELEKSEAGVTKPVSAPHDPLNPLNAAYDMRAYEMLRKLRLDEEHQMSQVAADEPEWDHLGYLRRSPSPCRLRTNGTMWPTRKGAWRSRAGGVYLPPEAGGEVERRGSASLSPAKWMYPEEFNRPFKEARRSPSYNRYDREEISSTSSSSSSSTVPKRRRKKRRPRSSSHESRPSPEYLPEA